MKLKGERIDLRGVTLTGGCHPASRRQDRHARRQPVAPQATTTTSARPSAEARGGGEAEVRADPAAVRGVRRGGTWLRSGPVSLKLDGEGDCGATSEWLPCSTLGRSWSVPMKGIEPAEDLDFGGEGPARGPPACLRGATRMKDSVRSTPARRPSPPTAGPPRRSLYDNKIGDEGAAAPPRLPACDSLETPGAPPASRRRARRAPPATSRSSLAPPPPTRPSRAAQPQRDRRRWRGGARHGPARVRQPERSSAAASRRRAAHAPPRVRRGS